MTMKFSDKLRAQRIKAGLTQEDLATQLGVTCRTLQNYESGAVYPKKRELYDRLAAFFENDVSYWLTESQEQPGIEKSVSAGSGWGRAFPVRDMLLSGDMNGDELDDFMQIVQDAYWEAKNKLRRGSGR